MGKKKRKYTPSQEKYYHEHPASTIRWENRQEKEKIQRAAALSGRSESEHIRIASLELADQYTIVHNNGVEEGKKRYEIWFYCKICGKPIFILPNTEVHNAIITYMREHGWSHGECIQKN